MARLGAPLWQRAQHELLKSFPQQLRKPWVILSDKRSNLEDSLGLSYSELLLFLSQQLRCSVALAHVSGNVYLGPDLKNDLNISGEQVLIANLFSHGEIGVDAIASPNALPDADTLPLLRAVATFPKLRWISGASAAPVLPSAPGRPVEPGAWAEVIKPVKRSLMKKYPLLQDLVDGSGSGTCLQHSNFIHHDISGENLEECQLSAARIAAKRAYGEGPDLAGCALLTSNGFILSGSEISSGPKQRGKVSPLQCALVSLGANGLCPSLVLSVAYVGQVGEDELLKEKVIPQALLQIVDIE